jgi:hypothetical protein
LKSTSLGVQILLQRQHSPVASHRQQSQIQPVARQILALLAQLILSLARTEQFRFAQRLLEFREELDRDDHL